MTHIERLMQLVPPAERLGLSPTEWMTICELETGHEFLNEDLTPLGSQEEGTSGNGLDS